METAVRETFGPCFLRVCGERAFFGREKKDEPVSYPCPSPSAARGIIEAVLWKPSIFWHIRRIVLLKPIRWFGIRVNEVKSRATPEHVLVVEEDRDQRFIHGLREVDYVIEAAFSFTERKGAEEGPEKFLDMYARRLSLGQSYFPPYLGRRDFTASFEEPPQFYSAAAELRGKTISLGMMLLDRRYSPDGIVPTYFNAEIKDGVLVEAGKETLPFFDPAETLA
jgi:CRISPR-associated protein Cas5d